MNSDKKKPPIRQYGFIILILIAIDQLTKFAAVLNLKNKDPFPIIPGVFELHYLENESAAFGIDPISLIQKIFQFQYFTENPDAFLLWKMIFFYIFTIAVCVMLFLFFLRIPHERRYLWLDIVITLFLSGAIGNLIDRIARKYVVDFFYFRLINFPIFNMADIYVSIAAILLVLLCFFYYREEDYAKIFPKEESE